MGGQEVAGGASQEVTGPAGKLGACRTEQKGFTRCDRMEPVPGGCAGPGPRPSVVAL